jgi:hypothetical protein
MSSKTLLMLAYHFPPENAIGAARPYRFYKYLRQFGWSPVVITAAHQDSKNADPNVQYIPDPMVTEKGSGGWHVDRILRRFFMPGEVGMVWSGRAARFCIDRIDAAGRDGPVVLYSTFPPLGTHLAALQVLRKRDVCWVADYRDPYAHHRERATWTTPVSVFISKNIERKMMPAAAVVIANTDTEAAIWKRRYPHLADRFHVIWNGYDPEEPLLARSLPEQKPKVILHAGALNWGRSARPVVESIDRLLRSGRLSAGSVQFKQIGPCEELAVGNPDLVERGRREGWLEIIPDYIPRPSAIQMAQNAYALFVTQPQSGTQVPGKLFEYIRIGRPLLSFIQKGSPIDRIVEACGIPSLCIYPGDSPDQVDSAVLRLLSTPSGPWKSNESFQRDFDAVRQTQTLCELIDKALENVRQAGT